MIISLFSIYLLHYLTIVILINNHQMNKALTNINYIKVITNQGNCKTKNIIGFNSACNNKYGR